ncbi:hypothetical protein ACFYQ5_03905 [Streptomyces sp. NPDC005794]|uniref:hypothetical protein n=1 Tax=Streptomyces sp. NPDC005794 TaxID=3364733 RepID=UPI0036BD0351
MSHGGTGLTSSPDHIDLGQEQVTVALRAVPLVGGPVEFRGALESGELSGPGGGPRTGRTGPDETDDLADGLHPTAAAYRRMGKRFAAHAFAADGAFL